MISKHSQPFEFEVQENKCTSLPGRHRLSKRWVIFGLATLLIAVMFTIVAPFTVNPYALSPIGMSFVLIPMSIVLWQVFKGLAQWINRENLASGAMAILVLTSSPVQEPAPVPSPLWNMMYENVLMMWNPAAWQAAFDFNTDIGAPGYAPLIYRPLVAEHPITLVAIPGESPGSFELFAAVSGLQAVPVSDSHAIWNTLHQHQTLQVQNTVLLTNDLTAYQLDPQMMVNRLSVNCTECRNTFQLNINPEYMEKLAWDTGVFIVGQMPLGRGVKAGDAITGAVLSGHLINGDMQAASATASGWATGQLVDFLDVDDSDTWIGALASHLAGNLVEKVVDPVSIGSTWNFQVFDGSIGIATDDFGAYAWQSQSISTYSGSFLGTDWKVETQGALHFAHVSSVDLDITTIDLPDLFRENLRMLNHSQATVPAITFSPTQIELPDVDIWQQPNPIPEAFPSPMEDSILNWTKPDTLPYNLPPATFENSIMPSNPAGTIIDINPYSPPQTTFEMPDYESLNIQPFNPSSITWP